MPAETLDCASRRIDHVIGIAGESERFDAEEFSTVSHDLAELKGELKAAENDEEYAPRYGTRGGPERESSNF